MNKTLGFLLLGGGAAWVAYQFGWLFAPAVPTPPLAPPATPPAAPPPASTSTPPAPTTPAPGSVSFSLVGPVAPDINNAIKGQVSIAGSVRTLDLTPDGNAWDTSGNQVTAALVAQGVDPNAILAAMQAALQAQTVVAGANVPPCAELPRAITAYAGLTDAQSVLRLAQLQAALKACPPAGTSGLGALVRSRKGKLYSITGATPINYVRKSRFA